MRRLRGYLQRHRTIWSPDAIPAEDARVAVLLQRVLPTVDLIMALFGTFVVIYGAPIFTVILGGTYPPAEDRWLLKAVSVLFGLIIAVSALVALWGLGTMRLLVELAAKLVLLTVFTIYPFFLTFGALDPARAAIGVLCIFPIPVLLWRIGDLGRERGKS